jgi:hypothetical protein
MARSTLKETVTHTANRKAVGNAALHAIHRETKKWTKKRKRERHEEEQLWV